MIPSTLAVSNTDSAPKAFLSTDKYIQYIS